MLFFILRYVAFLLLVLVGVALRLTVGYLGSFELLLADCARCWVWVADCFGFFGGVGGVLFTWLLFN